MINLSRLSLSLVLAAWTGFCVGAEPSPGGNAAPTAADAAKVADLVKALRDPDWEVKEQALDALREMGPANPAVIPALVGMLGADQDLAPPGVDVLLRDIGEAAVPELVEVLRKGEKIPCWEALLVLEMMRAHARGAIPALIEQLRQNNQDNRFYTLRTLAAIGPEGAKAAIPELIKLLKDDNERVRSNGARDLGQFGANGTAGVDALAEALGDPSWLVRKAAAEALGKIGPTAKDGARALADAMVDGDGYVRVAAARALWQVTGKTDVVVPVLVQGLADSGPRGPKLVRASAAEALGAIGREAAGAAPDLRKVIGDEDLQVHVAAAVALWHITGKEGETIGPLIHALRARPADQLTKDIITSQALDALSEMGAAAKPAVPALVGMLTDEGRPSRRFKIGQLLIHLGSAAAEAVPDLMKLLDAEDYDVRRQAIMVLGAIGPGAKDAVPGLIKVLDDREKHISNSAMSALATIGKPAEAALPELRKHIKSKNLEERISAIHAIWKIGGQAEEVVPLLMATLKEARQGKSSRTCEYVIDSLGEIGPPANETLGMLDELLTDKRFGVRSSAAVAVWKISGKNAKSIPVILPGLRSASSDERYRAAWALGAIGAGAGEHSPALVRLLADEDSFVRLTAIRALGKMGTVAKEAIPDLEKLLKAPGLKVRSDVSEALKKIRGEEPGK